MTTDEQRLVEAEHRLRQAQETLDNYRLWEYQLIFGIAYGASSEAWDTLEELRATIAQQDEEVARCQADVDRLKGEVQ